MENGNKQYKHYNLINKYFGYQKHIKILPIDFNESFWNIFWLQKGEYLFVLISILIKNIVFTLLPFLSILIITQQELKYLWALAALFVVLSIIKFFEFYYSGLLHNRMKYSFESHAAKFFLNIDPIHHSTRSSGHILSKTNRTSNSLTHLHETLLLQMAGVLTSFIVSIAALLIADVMWGLALFVFLFGIIFINSYLRIQIVKNFHPIMILAEDNMHQNTVEALAQTAYIRASFGTMEQIQKIEQAAKDITLAKSNIWHSHHTLDTFLEMFTNLSLIIVLLLLLNTLQENNISLDLATAIVTSYSIAISNILVVGSRIKRVFEDIHSINDFYEYLKGYGKQSFPV